MLAEQDFRDIAAAAERLGRHFTHHDVARVPALMGAALEYVADCDTTASRSLAQLQAAVLAGEFLTRTDAAHILNCLVADARRRQFERTSVP